MNILQFLPFLSILPFSLSLICNNFQMPYFPTDIDWLLTLEEHNPQTDNEIDCQSCGFSFVADGGFSLNGICTDSQTCMEQDLLFSTLLSYASGTDVAPGTTTTCCNEDNCNMDILNKLAEFWKDKFVQCHSFEVEYFPKDADWLLVLTSRAVAGEKNCSRCSLTVESNGVEYSLKAHCVLNDQICSEIDSMFTDLIAYTDGTDASPGETSSCCKEDYCNMNILNTLDQSFKKYFKKCHSFQIPYYPKDHDWLLSLASHAVPGEKNCARCSLTIISNGVEYFLETGCMVNDKECEQIDSMFAKLKTYTEENAIQSEEISACCDTEFCNMELLNELDGWFKDYFIPCRSFEVPYNPKDPEWLLSLASHAVPGEKNCPRCSLTVISSGVEFFLRAGCSMADQTCTESDAMFAKLIAYTDGSEVKPGETSSCCVKDYCNMDILNSLDKSFKDYFVECNSFKIPYLAKDNDWLFSLASHAVSANEYCNKCRLSVTNNGIDYSLEAGCQSRDQQCLPIEAMFEKLLAYNTVSDINPGVISSCCEEANCNAGLLDTLDTSFKSYFIQCNSFEIEYLPKDAEWLFMLASHALAGKAKCMKCSLSVVSSNGKEFSLKAGCESNEQQCQTIEVMFATLVTYTEETIISPGGTSSCCNTANCNLELLNTLDSSFKSYFIQCRSFDIVYYPKDAEWLTTLTSQAATTEEKCKTCMLSVKSSNGKDFSLAAGCASIGQKCSTINVLFAELVTYTDGSNTNPGETSSCCNEAGCNLALLSTLETSFKNYFIQCNSFEFEYFPKDTDWLLSLKSLAVAGETKCRKCSLSIITDSSNSVLHAGCAVKDKQCSTTEAVFEKLVTYANGSSSVKPGQVGACCDQPHCNILILNKLDDMFKGYFIECRSFVIKYEAKNPDWLLSLASHAKTGEENCGICSLSVVFDGTDYNLKAGCSLSGQLCSTTDDMFAKLLTFVDGNDANPPETSSCCKETNCNMGLLNAFDKSFKDYFIDCHSFSIPYYPKDSAWLYVIADHVRVVPDKEKCGKCSLSVTTDGKDFHLKGGCHVTGQECFPMDTLTAKVLSYINASNVQPQETRVCCGESNCNMAHVNTLDRLFKDYFIACHSFEIPYLAKHPDWLLLLADHAKPGEEKCRKCSLSVTTDSIQFSLKASCQLDGHSCSTIESMFAKLLTYTDGSVINPGETTACCDTEFCNMVLLKTLDKSFKDHFVECRSFEVPYYPKKPEWLFSLADHAISGDAKCGSCSISVVFTGTDSVLRAGCLLAGQSCSSTDAMFAELVTYTDGSAVNPDQTRACCQEANCNIVLLNTLDKLFKEYFIACHSFEIPYFAKDPDWLLLLADHAKPGDEKCTKCSLSVTTDSIQFSLKASCQLDGHSCSTIESMFAKLLTYTDGSIINPGETTTCCDTEFCNMVLLKTLDKSFKDHFVECRSFEVPYYPKKPEWLFSLADHAISGDAKCGSCSISVMFTGTDFVLRAGCLLAGQSCSSSDAMFAELVTYTDGSAMNTDETRACCQEANCNIVLLNTLDKLFKDYFVDCHSYNIPYYPKDADWLLSLSTHPVPGVQKCRDCSLMIISDGKDFSLKAGCVALSGQQCTEIDAMFDKLLTYTNGTDTTATKTSACCNEAICNMRLLKTLEMKFKEYFIQCHSFKTPYFSKDAEWLTSLASHALADNEMCGACSISVELDHTNSFLKAGCMLGVKQCSNVDVMFATLLKHTNGSAVTPAETSACCYEVNCNMVLLNSLEKLFKEYFIDCHSFKTEYHPKDIGWLYSLADHTLEGVEKCGICSISVAFEGKDFFLKGGCFISGQQCSTTKTMFSKLLTYINATSVQPEETRMCCSESNCNMVLLQELDKLFKNYFIKCHSFETSYYPKNTEWLYTISEHATTGEEICRRCGLSISTDGSIFLLKAHCLVKGQSCIAINSMFDKLITYTEQSQVNQGETTVCCDTDYCNIQLLDTLETLFQEHFSIPCYSLQIQYYARKFDWLRTLVDQSPTDQERCLECSISVVSNSKTVLIAGCALSSKCVTKVSMFEKLLSHAAGNDVISANNIGPVCCQKDLCNDAIIHELGNLFYTERCWSFVITDDGMQVIERKDTVCEKSHQCIVSFQKSESDGLYQLHGHCYPSTKLDCQEPSSYMCYMRSVADNFQKINDDRLAAVCCPESFGTACDNDIMANRLTGYMSPIIGCPPAVVEVEQRKCETFDDFDLYSGDISGITALQCSGDQVCGLQLQRSNDGKLYLVGQCFEKMLCDNDMEKFKIVALDLLNDIVKPVPSDLKPICCIANWCNREHAEIVYIFLQNRKCSVFNSELTFQLESTIAKQPSTAARTQCVVHIKFEPSKKSPVIWAGTTHRSLCDHSTVENLFEDAKVFISKENVDKLTLSNTFCCFTEDGCNFKAALILGALIHERKCWSYESKTTLDDEISKNKTRMLCSKSNQCIATLKKNTPGSVPAYILVGQCHPVKKLKCQQPPSYMCYMRNVINYWSDIDQNELPAVCCAESYGIACHNDLFGERLTAFTFPNMNCPVPVHNILSCESFAEFYFDTASMSESTTFECDKNQVCGVKLAKDNSRLHLNGNCMKKENCEDEMQKVYETAFELFTDKSKSLPAGLKAGCCSTDRCNKEHAEIIYGLVHNRICSVIDTNLTFQLLSNVAEKAGVPARTQCFLQIVFQRYHGNPLIYGGTIHWTMCKHSSEQQLFDDAQELMNKEKVDKITLSSTFCCFKEDKCNYKMALRLGELIHQRKCWSFISAVALDSRNEIKQNKKRKLCGKSEHCVVTMKKIDSQSSDPYYLIGQCYLSANLQCQQPESFMCYMLSTINNLQDIDESTLPAVCCKESYGVACHNDLVGQRLTAYAFPIITCPTAEELNQQCELFTQFDLNNGAMSDSSTITCDENEVCGVELTENDGNAMYLKGKCFERIKCENEVQRISEVALEMSRDNSKQRPEDLKGSCCSTDLCNLEHAERVYNFVHERECATFQSDLTFEITSADIIRSGNTLASTYCFVLIILEPNTDTPIVWGDTIHRSKCVHNSEEKLFNDAKHLMRLKDVSQTTYSEIFCCNDKNLCNYDTALALAEFIHKQKCWKFYSTTHFDEGRKQIDETKTNVFCEGFDSCIVAVQTEKVESSGLNVDFLYGKCYPTDKVVCYQPEAYMCYMLSQSNNTEHVGLLPAICCPPSFGTACHNDLVGKRLTDHMKPIPKCSSTDIQGFPVNEILLNCESFDRFDLTTGTMGKTVKVQCQTGEMCGVELQINNPNQPFLKGKCISRLLCDYDIQNITNVALELLTSGAKSAPNNLKARCCSTDYCNREHAELMYNFVHYRKCSAFRAELTFDLPTNIRTKPSVSGSTMCFVQLLFDPDKAEPVIWGNTVHWTECDYTFDKIIKEILFEDAKKFMRMGSVSEVVVSETFCCYDEDNCNYDIALAVAEYIHKQKCWLFSSTTDLKVGPEEIRKNKKQILCDKGHQCIVALQTSKAVPGDPYILHGECYSMAKLVCDKEDLYMCYMYKTIKDKLVINTDSQVRAFCCPESSGIVCHIDLVATRFTRYKEHSKKCNQITGGLKLECASFDQFSLVTGRMVNPMTTIVCADDEVCGVKLLVDNQKQPYLKGHCTKEVLCEYDIKRVSIAALKLIRKHPDASSDIKTRCCSTNMCNYDHTKIVHQFVHERKCSTFYTDLSLQLPTSVKNILPGVRANTECFVQLKFEPNNTVPIVWGETIHVLECDYRTKEKLFEDSKRFIRLGKAGQSSPLVTFCCDHENYCNFAILQELGQYLHDIKCWSFESSTTFDVGRHEIEANKTRILCDSAQKCVVALQKQKSQLSEPYFLHGQCYASTKLKCYQPEAFMCYMLETIKNSKNIGENQLPAVCCQESFGTACHNDIVGKRLTEYSYPIIKCPPVKKSELQCESFSEFDMVSGDLPETAAVSCSNDKVCGVEFVADNETQLLKGECMDKSHCDYHIDTISNLSTELLADSTKLPSSELRSRCCSTDKCNRDHAELLYDTVHKRNCSNFRNILKYGIVKEEKNLPDVEANTQCFVQLIFEPDKEKPIVWANTVHWSECDHNSMERLLSDAEQFMMMASVNETTFSDTFCCYNENNCNFIETGKVTTEILACMRKPEFQEVIKKDSIHALHVGADFETVFLMMPNDVELEMKCPEFAKCRKLGYINSEADSNLFKWTKTNLANHTAYFRLSSTKVNCSEAPMICQNFSGIFLDVSQNNSLINLTHNYVDKIIAAAGCVWHSGSQGGNCSYSKTTYGKLEKICQCSSEDCLFFTVCMRIKEEYEECQKQKYGADVDLLRETFRTAAEGDINSVDDLLSMINGSERLLRASKSIDPGVMLENAKMFEKIDYIMNEEMMGNVGNSLAMIFRYAAFLNLAMNMSQKQQITTAESNLVKIVVADEKEKFAEHADNLFERLTRKLIDNETFESLEIVVPGGKFELIPVNISNLTETVMIDHRRVLIPPLVLPGSLSCQNDQPNLYLKIVSYDSNFYEFVEPWRLLNGGTINVSIVTTKCGDDHGEVKISGTHKPIVLRFPIENADDITTEQTYFTPSIDHHFLMAYHEILIEGIHTDLIIVVNKSNPNSSLVLYFHQNALPWPTDFLDAIEFPCGEDQIVWSPKIKMSENQRYVLGIAENNSESESVIHFAGYSFSRNFTSDYSVKFFVASCLFLDFEPTIQDVFWSSDGCKVNENISESQLICMCNHLSTFGAGLFVPTTSLDVRSIIQKLSVRINLTIFCALLISILLYILCIIWGFFKDKNSKISDVCFLLPDNVISDSYIYRIALKTGYGSGASTDSVIRFVLAGKEGSTPMRRLPNSKEFFRRGHTDYFQLTTESSLGELHCCQIWHDNRGKGKFASWFLSSIVIYDAIEHRFYHFISNKWLSYDHKPYLSEQMLPICDVTTVRNCKVAFDENLSRNFFHEQLWFSIMLMPKMSIFTRCQRITCCFSIIFTSMLACAVWYGKSSNTVPTNSVKFGMFIAGWNEVFVGIIISLIVFPTNFLIVQLFKRSKQRNHAHIVKKSPILPWWGVYVGWTVASLTILLSIVFSYAYALRMSDSATRKWLSSFFVSLISSIFVIQSLEELQMYSFLREIIVTIAFITAVFILVYCNRDSNGYFLQKQVKQTLTQMTVGYQNKSRRRQLGLSDDEGKFKIDSEEDLWDWITDIVVPALSRENSMRKSFMIDQVNLIVGYSRIRQIRIKKYSCFILRKVRHLFHDCVDFLTMTNADYTAYGPGWMDKISKYRPEYQYAHHTDALHDGIFGSYWEGGYTLVLRKRFERVQKRLTTLNKERWIDYQTRAVIIEFSIYNAQVNLFCVAYIMVETPPIGGFFPTFDLRIVQLLKEGDVIQVCAEFLCILLVLIHVYGLGKKMMQNGWQNFFNSWNNELDLIAIVICIFIAAIYFIRQNETDRVMEIMRKSQGHTYVDFSYAATLEQTYNYLLGLVAFVVTIKFLILLRFIKNISLMIDSLKFASTRIIGFGMVSVIVMSSFAALMNLLLGRHMERFSTFFSCFEKCFGISFSRREFYGVINAKALLGGITILGYFSTSLLLIHTLFITTITVMVDEVKRNTEKQTDDYETILIAKRKILDQLMDTQARKKFDLRDFNEESEHQLQLLENRGQHFEKCFSSYFSHGSKNHDDKNDLNDEKRTVTSNDKRSKIICSD